MNILADIEYILEHYIRGRKMSMLGILIEYLRKILVHNSNRQHLPDLSNPYNLINKVDKLLES